MSDKSKRKGIPHRHKVIWVLLAISLFLLSAALFFNCQDCSTSTEAPLDYAATATRIIADATQTAVSYLNEGCEMIESTRWTLNLYITNDGIIDSERSGGRNSSYRSNWLCNGELQFQHEEYSFSVHIEPDDIDFSTLIADVIGFLADYPPDNSPDIEPVILLNIFQSATVIPASQYLINYHDAMEAIDSGLTGQELLDSIVVPQE